MEGGRFTKLLPYTYAVQLLADSFSYKFDSSKVHEKEERTGISESLLTFNIYS